MEKRKLNPYHGIIIFVVVILMLLFVAAPIQYRFGLYGVLLTEILLVMLSFAAALLYKADLKSVFPVKVPKLRQICGVVILWIGGFLVVILVTLIIGYFFPEGLFEVGNSLQEIFTSVPMVISFLIVAVSPAICEEILVRGFILSSFRTLKNKWLIVSIVGVLFGIFHLDPYRFLPTAILGLLLSYIMLETNNILLPALFHFINNGFSSLTSFLTKNDTMQALDTIETTRIPLISIGIYFILASAAPFLMFAGSKLLHLKYQPASEEDYILKQKQNRKVLWTAVAITIFMFITGFIITLIGMFQSDFTEMLKEYSQSIEQ